MKELETIHCNESVHLASKSIDMIDAVEKGYEKGYIDGYLKAIENSTEQLIEIVKQDGMKGKGTTMERLTLKFPNGYLFKLPSAKDEIAQDKFANKLAEKLGEYEDFEEIFRAKMTDTACEFLSDKEEFEKWLDRNKWIAKKCDEYARAEEQGLLLRLPCKVGDTVYYRTNNNDIYPIKINEINISNSDVIYNGYLYFINCTYEFDNSDFGKTVFLTKEEAEQKLKKMEEMCNE